MDRKQLADAIDAVQSHSELGNLVSRVLWPFFDELNAMNEHVRRRCDEAVKEARKECESLLALSKRIEELKQALASAYVPPSPAEEADEDDAGLRGEADAYILTTDDDGDRITKRLSDGVYWVGGTPALVRELNRLATRPRPAPQPATGDGVREEVVSELSRAIDLIDHEDQAATREARDLLIRLKALLSAQPGAGEVDRG